MVALFEAAFPFIVLFATIAAAISLPIRKNGGHRVEVKSKPRRRLERLRSGRPQPDELVNSEGN